VHALVREFNWGAQHPNQLLHLAEDDGASAVEASLESTLRITQDAAKTAAAQRSNAESLVIAV
jgi:hypothetical protein